MELRRIGGRLVLGHLAGECLEHSDHFAPRLSLHHDDGVVQRAPIGEWPRPNDDGALDDDERSLHRFRVLDRSPDHLALEVDGVREVLRVGVRTGGNGPAVELVGLGSACEYHSPDPEVVKVFKGTQHWKARIWMHSYWNWNLTAGYPARRADCWP